MSRGNQEGVKTVSRGCQEHARRMSRMSQEGVKRVSRECQEDVKRMSIGSQKHLKMVSRGLQHWQGVKSCKESVKMASRG